MLMSADSQVSLHDCRIAQAKWSSIGLASRLTILRKARHQLARISDRLVDAIPSDLARTRADSYVAEVLPLLAACKFLEDEAGKILKPRKLGRKGRPLWLTGVHTIVERVPFGVVLVIAPANYPLLLAGVQTLQALAAGNAVIWKPGRGGQAVANVFASALLHAGLPEGLLTITEESPAAAISAITAHPDKIFFTGSAHTGREVLRMGADLAIPVVAELSGCDAAVVLPSANAELVLDALCFGMRLNGSSTCMAPRRLLLVGDSHTDLLANLRERFAAVTGIRIAESTRQQLTRLIEDALMEGATVHGDLQAPLLKPIFVEDGNPRMQIAQTDIFAPVITALHVPDTDALIEVDRLCPLGLTASIFGKESEARALGDRLNVGTVIINDLIVPTADPRVSFGGRRGSGFGVTRGAEGLLEMTAVKTTAIRRGRAVRQYQPTTETHENLFGGLVELSHGRTLRQKISGLRTLIAAATKLRKSQNESGRTR